MNRIKKSKSNCQLKLESLEPRCMLTTAPVAFDDIYNTDEDTLIVVDEFDYSADFDSGTSIGLISTGATWQYLDQIQNSLGNGDSYPIDGSALTWNDPNFDTSTSTVGPWGSGATPLVAGVIDGAPSAPDVLFGIGDAPGGDNLITTYLFRTEINVDATAAAQTSATANLLCDDGCIVYINGIQSFSWNLEPDNWNPSGPLTTETFTGGFVDEIYREFSVDLTAVNWQEGINTVAVEVHQINTSSSDVGFDLELTAGDSPTDGFSFVPDAFGTNAPSKAGGSLDPSGGNPDGALMVDIGRRQSNGRRASSAAWVSNFDLPGDMTVQVDLDFRMLFSEQYESNENSEAIFEIDGVRYGNDTNNSLKRFVGNGDGGGDDDTGWLSESFQIPLTAGNHTITIGAFNNRANVNDEFTQVWFDNISIAPVGGSADGTVLVNDTDAEGDPLTAVLVDDVSNGSLTLNADGSFSYLPSSNFNGTDTFTYRANDGDQDSNLATVTINVAAVNDPPVALFKNYDANEDTTLVIDAANGLLIGATDIDNLPGELSAVETLAAGNGQLNVNSDGSFSYTPNLNFTGLDTFRFAVSDGTDLSEEVTATINVQDTNDAPVVLDDSYSVLENTTLVADQLVSSDTQVLISAGSTWRYFDGGVSQHGLGNNNPADSTWFGSVNFDDSGWNQENAPGNNGAQYGYGDGDEATQVEFGPDDDNKYPTTYFRRTFQVDDLNSITGLTLSMIRDDAAAVFINGQPGPIDNLVVGAQYDDFADNPVSSSDENTFFNYNVSPALLVEGENVIAVEVHQANGTSSDLSFDLDLVADITNDNTSVLVNDSDPEDDSFTASLVQDVSNGTLSFQSDGTFTYTPNINFEGVETFTYIANDGTSDSTEATVIITVIPGPNDIPIANDDISLYSIDEDNTLIVDNVALGVLNNDTDGENEPLSASIETDPGNGSVIVNSDGTFTYTPNENFFGEDTFTYRAFDGTDFSSPATVSIIVNPIDDPPVATVDHYFAQPDTAINISAALGLLMNDVDVDLEPITAVLDVTTSNGILILSSDGSFTYTPNNGFLGNDTFTYRANDGDDDSNLATVTITVDGKPTADSETYNTNEDLPLIVTSVDSILIGDLDPENDPLTTILNTPPSNGNLSLNSDGTFTYTPNLNYFGSDSFTYVANDGDQDSDPATVTINIAAINDKPDADDDDYDVVQNNTLVIDANDGVLENDSDVDSGSLTVSLAVGGDVLNGTLVLAADGSFTYTPNTDFFGIDTFNYITNDGQLDSDPATVTINVTPPSSSVIINEIMYHPSTENDAEEYIELVNLSIGSVDLTGWQFSKGVDFTFPSVSIGAGEYLVIAADTAAFAAKYPGVTSTVIGGWLGKLSNSSEEIELEDETGDRVDRVTYADEGDWALRREGPNDRGHNGWDWVADHDGDGSSLELINPEVSNRRGQNWLASNITDGTPGAANSVANSDTAPLIWDVKHSPAVPTSTDTVTVVAKLADTEGDVLSSVEVMYRESTLTPGAFIAATMFDNGLHGDGEAGDGEYGAILPAQANLTVIEFYVQAEDANGNIRTWPGPTDGSGTQGANLLYQVDDFGSPSDQPTYRLIMTAAENQEFDNIDRQSNAQMNATLINSDGTGTDVRYNVGVRIRGAGSRNRAVPNNRVNIPSDRPWQGVSAINVNTQYTHSQLVGMTMFDAAGLSFEEPVAVQVIHNGENRATQQDVQHGSYMRLEVTDSDLTANHWPNDPNGNFYRGTSGGVGALDYVGENESSYYGAYSLKTNTSLNDYSGIVDLTRALDETETPDPIFVDTVKQIIDVNQWMRFFAVNALLVNDENSLINGRSDDYSMYQGVLDPRFHLVPHDMDTVLNEGDTNNNLWDRDIFEIGSNPRIQRLLDQPEFLNLYYYHLEDLATTVFSAAQLNPTLDNLLNSWVDAQTIQDMKDFAALRVGYVLGEVAAYGPGVSIPPVAFISGEPVGTTPLDSAVLTISGNDIIEYQYSVNGGAFSSDITVATPITLTGLADGVYTVTVLGRNSKNELQPISEASVSHTWTVDSGYSGLRISEVLADNQSFDHEGTLPDMIELVNTSGSLIQLDDLQISDSSDPTDAFVFPAGLSLNVGERLVLYANSPDGTSGIHLGFSLNRNGDGVYLFDTVANSSTLLDSLEFGIQIPDLSLSRGANFIWHLSTPTFGAANLPVAMGDPATLKINEWLAEGDRLFKEDRIEIYNPDVNPVALGNMYLTDNLGGNRDKHEIAPLSFINGSGYSVFLADENSSAGADHVNFKLSPNRESIALLTKDLQLIDHVIFGPQSNDISDGRQLDGDPIYTKFSPPTFGLSNSDSSSLPDALGLLDGLRITELMYHPLDDVPNSIDDRDFEYVELQNIGFTTLNLENVKITGGIDYTFGDVDLAPGAYIVVVKDLALFESRYGTGLPVASGVYTSRLDNGGENIKLQLPAPFDGDILDFTYRDDWYPMTDGAGHSLQIVDPTAEPALWDKAIGWEASNAPLGSPGTDDSFLLGDLNLDNIVDSLDLAIILQNYGTAGNASNLLGDLDGDNNIGLADLLLLKKNYGNTLSAPTPVAAAASITVTLGDRIVSNSINTNNAIDHVITEFFNDLADPHQTEEQENERPVRESRPQRHVAIVDQVHEKTLSPRSRRASIITHRRAHQRQLSKAKVLHLVVKSPY